MTRSFGQHIASLLYSHQYVVIPGFGGLIANKVSARTDTYQRLIHPPQKRVLFNENVKEDDGLLVSEIARIESVTYEQARTIVDENVSIWKKELHQNGEVLLEDLGKIHLDPQKKLIFTQFSVSNFLIPSYGLEIAKAQPVIYSGAGAKTYGLNNTRPETVVIERLPVSYKRFRAISVGLIAVLSFSAVYLYMLSFHPVFIQEAGLNPLGIPLITDRTSIQDTITPTIEDLNKQLDELEDFEEKTAKLTNTSANKEISTTNQASENPNNETEVVEHVEEKIQEKDQSTEVDKPTQVITTTTQPSEYHVIVSALNDIKKANKATQQFRLKGYEATIIPEPNGVYRVSLGSFASKDSAETFRKNIRNDNNIDGWILTK